jgi:starch-binding outer membrane protein, SusD/RagB family
LLLNDIFETTSNLSYYQLYKANYNWDESADRIVLNNSDEGAYYNGYGGISIFNLIKEYAPDATEASDQEKTVLIAQAKTALAQRYFVLANYYADTYDAATAASKLSVPLIESAVIDAPHRQVTIAEIYDYMLKNLEEALPGLPDVGATPLHPTKGAAYALRARIYLQMEQYDKALADANEALKVNDKLFDWPEFYNTYKEQIEQAGIYPSLASPMNFTYVENYLFSHGELSRAAREDGMRVDRAERFEEGDARFASRWKLRTINGETYYYSITRGHYNKGGLTTAEIYLIKAECLARANDIDAAMDILNTVRAKRIMPDMYADAEATTQLEAINLIRRTKDNELAGTIVPFADARRFNKYPEYSRTLTKEEDGQNLSLSPNSHMWTMPFPLGAIKNPGNGTILQNVDK